MRSEVRRFSIIIWNQWQHSHCCYFSSVLLFKVKTLRNNWQSRARRMLRSYSNPANRPTDRTTDPPKTEQLLLLPMLATSQQLRGGKNTQFSIYYISMYNQLTREFHFKTTYSIHHVKLVVNACVRLCFRNMVSINKDTKLYIKILVHSDIKMQNIAQYLEKCTFLGNFFAYSWQYPSNML